MAFRHGHSLRNRKSEGFFSLPWCYVFCFGLGLLVLGLGSFFFLWGSWYSGGAECAFTFHSLEALGAPEAVLAYSAEASARISVHISAVVPGPLGAEGTAVPGALQERALALWNSAAGKAATLAYIPPEIGVRGPLQAHVEVLEARG